MRENGYGPGHNLKGAHLNEVGKRVRDQWVVRLADGEGAVQNARAVLVSALEERLKNMKNRLGAEHGLVIVAQHSLAVALMQRGRRAEAEKIFRDVAQWNERMLGKENVHTAIALGFLAMTLDDKEAVPLHRRCIGILEPVLGAEHPTTLAALGNLGHALTRQGKADTGVGQGRLRDVDDVEADSLLERSFKISERARGKDHPDMLTALSDFAASRARLGLLKEAAALNEQCVKSRTRVLGNEHPDTLDSLNNLACMLKLLHRVREAEPLQRRCFETRERLLGSEHPHTLIALSNLASILVAQERFSEAEPLQKRYLEIRMREKASPLLVHKLSIDLGVSLSKQGKPSGLVMIRHACEQATSYCGLGGLDPPMLQEWREVLVLTQMEFKRRLSPKIEQLRLTMLQNESQKLQDAPETDSKTFLCDALQASLAENQEDFDDLCDFLCHEFVAPIKIDGEFVRRCGKDDAREKAFEVVVKAMISGCDDELFASLS